MKPEAQAENWQKIKEIFSTALEKDAGERAAFVTAVCAGDTHLQAEVESWLNSHAEAGEFIENPAFSVNEIFIEEAQNSGKRFGNYRIIEEIGRGGMGTVFLAERADGEFNQQVALKIVRRTIVDRETENRFRRERQILASLNHSNIAKLLDGGVSDAGEPFLVMEFVKGNSLVEFADFQNLSIKKRLKLFTKICSAVSFAHRNLIVHRDLKPSNIIINDEGEPKLLDFGLAKILDLENEQTQTAVAFRAFTPSYASPEQLRGETVSTASDIYSLGIILYELLTGKRPFDFQGKTLEQIVKTVTETAPVLPSKVQNLISGNQSLKGDIDNIISVALRSEPERRYKSVEAFAEDIEDFLTNQPVKARPATWRYRAGKFIRRNRLSVAAAILICLSLVGGIVVSFWQTRQARLEKAKAETVNAFLQNMLNYSDNSLNLSRPKGQDMTVKDVLNEASRRLETEDLSSQPEIKAELHRIIGSSYLTQGNYESAEKNLRLALKLQMQIYGEESPETLPTLVDLAQAFLVRADYENAEKIYRQRLSVLRREQQKGSINPTYLLVALNDYAVLRRAQGNSPEAEALLREGLALKSRIPAENKMVVGVAESVYALILSDQGKFDEAEEIVRARIAEIRRQPNPETLELAANLNGLGNFLMEKGRLTESLQNFLEAEKIYRKLSNETYLPLGDNLRYQAQVFYLQGNFAEAENKINETLTIYRASSTAKYVNYPTALTVQGLIFNRTNRSVEAEKILREAVQIRAEMLPREHFLSAFSINALGECLTTQKRYDEAEPLLSESYESLKNSQGTDNPRTKLALRRLISLYESWGKKETAKTYRKTI